MPDTFYSDHFDGVANTVLDEQKRVDAGIGHGRLRYSRAEVTTLAAPDLPSDGDTIRMMQFKSGDRLNHIFLTSTDSGAAGAVNIGLRKSGYAHDGAVIEGNVFGASIDVNSAALAHVEKLGTGNPDADLARGKALWEVTNLAGATPTSGYTADPMEDWDLSFYFMTAPTVATTFILEVYFTGGD